MSLRETTAEKAVFALLVILALAISGCIDSPGDGVKVITLGASDCRDHVGDFSGSGPTRDGRTKPTVVAPGVDVVSTVPPGLEEPDYIDVYYARESGTSLSTPVAAGVAALLLQAEPDMTPAGIKAAITKGAQKLNNTMGEEYEEYYQGAGRIDAERSYRLLDEDICGVMPEKWMAGRWAFPGGGKAISPGIETGADRPQKKLYALAPTDEDWTTRFVFFTNRDRTGINTEATGQVADWITIQNLPKSIQANGQKVFGGTINVPEGTPPGLYNGSVEVYENGSSILSIPVTVEVARPIQMIRGTGAKADVLQKNQWHYYYVDVPLGTDQLDCILSWKGGSELDLFMLAPTSEYYPGDQLSRSEEAVISDPPSGRWLVAVHARNLTGPESYTLEVVESFLDSQPKRWNLGTVAPGDTRTAEFELINMGPDQNDLRYRGVIENSTVTRLEGSVEDRGSWRVEVDVGEDVDKLSAKLTWSDEMSDLDLFLYDLRGDMVKSSEGTVTVEELEHSELEPGKWYIDVYGYEVPGKEEQPFNLELIAFSKETWSWISARGPGNLSSGSRGKVEAEIVVPDEVEDLPIKGYIEVSSTNSTHEIGVTASIGGASITGASDPGLIDRDGDGYFDQLSIGVEIEAPVPGDYRLEGSLTDCNGDLIAWLIRTEKVGKRDLINLDASGSEIWRRASCGPLGLDSLYLYNRHGELIDVFQGGVSINRDPREFQPPPAYFDGRYDMEASIGKVKRIEIGVGVTVIKPGSYVVEGRLVDDSGNEIDFDKKSMRLEAGNQTVLLDFNPTKFLMLQKDSRLHLKNLTLALNERELEKLDEAWSTEMLSPGTF